MSRLYYGRGAEQPLKSEAYGRRKRTAADEEPIEESS